MSFANAQKLVYILTFLGWRQHPDVRSERCKEGSADKIYKAMKERLDHGRDIFDRQGSRMTSLLRQALFHIEDELLLKLDSGSRLDYHNRVYYEKVGYSLPRMHRSDDSDTSSKVMRPVKLDLFREIVMKAAVWNMVFEKGLESVLGMCLDVGERGQGKEGREIKNAFVACITDEIRERALCDVVGKKWYPSDEVHEGMGWIRIFDMWDGLKHGEGEKGS